MVIKLLQYGINFFILGPKLVKESSQTKYIKISLNFKLSFKSIQLLCITPYSGGLCIFSHLSIFPSAAPASFEPEKSHLCSGPRWPEMEQRLSQNWNWRIVRVKYLRGKASKKKKESNVSSF